MTLFASPPPRPLAAALLGSLCLLLTNVGCGHGHANSRPASSLSPADRDTLDQYEHIRTALARDDLRSARVAAITLATHLKPADAAAAAPALLTPVQGVATAPALDRARQLFKILSAKVIPLADGVEGYYVMTCPLPSSGDWVQQTAQADNPYLGKAMHEYGEVRK